MSKILIIEPFFGGSHRQWAEGWQRYSEHGIKLLTLSAHHWKWRMHGGAITLAEQFMEMDFQPDWIVASDMLDLSVFLAMTRPKSDGIPTAVYFHENQLTYPWSATDRDPRKEQDNHYKFINYGSALVADRCLFNSQYHLDSFLEALPLFLRKFPDHRNIKSIEKIRQKSSVLPLGMDLTALDHHDAKDITDNTPILLWNHRWEYDKNPADFFEALYEMKKQGIPFKLVVLGAELRKVPPVFAEAKEKLKDHTLHWGYCEDRETYRQWLWQADILPVTSNQDFFGGSIIEAVYCDTVPLLPQRLAYPEHFPNCPSFYYKDDDEFTKSLVQLIDTFHTQRPINTQKLVKKYDWNRLIDTYDEIFR